MKISLKIFKNDSNHERYYYTNIRMWDCIYCIFHFYCIILYNGLQKSVYNFTFFIYQIKTFLIYFKFLIKNQFLIVFNILYYIMIFI